MLFFGLNDNDGLQSSKGTLPQNRLGMMEVACSELIRKSRETLEIYSRLD